MKELNEIKQALKYLEIDAKTYADNFSASMIVSTKNILAIAEAFQALEQRAEAAEAASAKWKEEAIKAHEESEIVLAKLAELAKQKPMGRLDRGEVSDSNEYPDARVLCLHEHVGWEAFQDGTEPFIRPVPAADLAKLVPDEKPKTERGANLRAFTHWHDGWNSCRAAILRNIKEAK